eukprot:jgi/Mesvir1/24824/Mv22064-RA.1
MKRSSDRSVRKPAILTAKLIAGENGVSKKVLKIATGVASLDWSPFLQFLSNSTDSGNSLKDFEAKECIVELIRFLLLKAQAEDPSNLSPTWLVDEVWHRLLLFPRLYSEVCQAICGDIIDHDPNAAAGPPAKRSARIHNTMDAYAKAFPGPPSKLWASGLPSPDITVQFQHDGSEYATLSLPRTMSETEILATLSDMTGIRASAIELVWPQRAVQSAEFPLKTFGFDGRGLTMDGKPLPTKYDHVIADARWAPGLVAKPFSKEHPDAAITVFVLLDTGNKMLFKARRTCKIGKLMRALAQTMGIAADSCSLVWDGTVLQIHDTLEGQDICDGDTLEFHLKILGC